MADAWGTFVERRRLNESGTWNWLIGEEVRADAYALRDMSNPPGLGPENLHHMRQFSARIDGHLTCQILNKWAYLWVHGGTHPLSRVRVTGMQARLGEERAFQTAERAYYRAMRLYLPHTATFRSFRAAMLRAVRDIAGSRGAAYAEASRAFQAIGLR